MGNSVTRVIWIEGDILLEGCISCKKTNDTNDNIEYYATCQDCKKPKGKKRRANPKWEVWDLFRKMPKGTRYIVRYVLDDKGPLLAVMKTIMVIISLKTKKDMSACFLPASWDGRRVRRKVIAPIYEIGHNL